MTAVHVEHLSTLSSFGLGSTLGEVYEADEKVRSELIEEAQRRSGEVTLEVVIHKGRPAEHLLAVAASVDADLIVVGHTGRGGGVSWMGSVSNEVVHQAPCSVMIAR